MMSVPGGPEKAVPPPNPGSIAALLLGCLCGIFANHEGERAPYPPDSWLVTMGCPVHAPGETRVRRLGVRR